MFTKPTVFILGAGASWHYGYPTGPELIYEVSKIGQSFLNALKAFSGECSRIRFSSDGDPGRFLPKYIIKKMEGIEEPSFMPAIEETISECEVLIDRIRQVDPLVIDYFLDNNETLQDLGKLLISFVILSSDKIFEKGTVARERGNWCRYIIHHMMMGCNNPEEFLEENRVKFVTFNYDLSLEKNLYQSLSENDFFPDKDVINTFLGEDRVVHVYGMMADNNYQPASIRFQGDFLNKMTEWKDMLDPAYIASEGLLTIAPGDKIKDKTSLELAGKAIREAEEVFILGYGFDRLNSKNIGLTEHLNHTNIVRNFGSENKEEYKGKRIYFTNFENKNVVSKRASNIFYSNPSEFLPPNGLISADKRRSVHYEMSTKNVYNALADDFEFLD